MELASFGSWVKKRRKHLGLTRKVLASLIGCSPVTIQKIEQEERRPSVQIARLLAQHLQIPEISHDTFIRRARGEFVATFPFVESLAEHTATKPHNLPSEVTPFIGREKELVQVQKLLAQSGQRLITIVAAGGMGKTRLALATAQQLLDDATHYPNGIFFVPLAPLNDPMQIPLAIAEALDITFYNTNQQMHNVKQQILEYLDKKQMLLILDNFEHLLAGVDLIVELLGAVDGVQILVTSRERLNLREEQQLPIEGLTFPTLNLNLDDAGTYTAVKLFLQAANRIQPDFSMQIADLGHITRICQLVEGMPLGLELAAGWVGTLPLETIATELQRNNALLESNLRNMPARHRSMQIVFDYSWGYLEEAEQYLFAQLAIFRGGFTLQAAQAITGASLRALHLLVAKSFLQFSQAKNRYQVHELLRQFGVEQLTMMPTLKNSVIAKYSRYYCRLAASQLADLVGAHRDQALATLGQDMSNITQAWSEALSRAQYPLMIQAADVVGYFHEWRGHYEAGLALFAATATPLSAATHKAGLQLRIRATVWQAVFLQLQGKFLQAEDLLHQCLILLTDDRARHDSLRGEKAVILLRLGIGQTHANIAKESLEMLEQSQTLFAAVGDKWGQARALEELGRTRAFIFEDPESVDQILSNCLALYRELGNQRSTAHTLGWLALSASYQANFTLAAQYAQECLEICQQLNSRVDLAFGLQSYGMMICRLGRVQEAYELLEEALALYLELGNRLQGMFIRSDFAHVSAMAGLAEQAREQLEFNLHKLPDRGYKAKAWHSTGLAQIASFEQNYEQAYTYAQEGLHYWSQSNDQSSHVNALIHAALGRAQYGLGAANDAKLSLAFALEAILDSRNAFILVDSVMPHIALVLATEGECELALRIDAMLVTHLPVYNHSDYFIQSFRKPILAHCQRETPDILDTSQNPDEQVDPWGLAREVMAHLARFGWTKPG